MNIWKYILFYIYSGVALGGLCAGKASELVSVLGNDGTSAGKEEALGKLIFTSQQIGNEMANATTSNLVASYKHEVLQELEMARHAAQQQKLALVPPTE